MGKKTGTESENYSGQYGKYYDIVYFVYVGRGYNYYSAKITNKRYVEIRKNKDKIEQR